MNFKEIWLEKGEYFDNETIKDTICIHHTAGGHRPDWTVSGWNADRTSGGSRIRVATHFVIGGISVSDNNSDFDGVIVKCMNEKHWAHHLGIKSYNNTHLNQKTIGIEICNYGQLTKSRDGEYFNYVNKKISSDQVVDLEYEFKGYRYYHKYTAKQIQALKELLIYLGKEHGIDLKKGLQERILAKDANPFDLNKDALSGAKGIWNHTSYRKDKFDMSPQPELLKMLCEL